MATITVLPHEELCPEGATFEAPAGISLCQALLDQHIDDYIHAYREMFERREELERARLQRVAKFFPHL